MRRKLLDSIDGIPRWCKQYGVDLHAVKIAKTAHGLGLEAGASIAKQKEVLLRIPSSLVLDLNAIQRYAQTDHHLKDVLDAVGEFGETSRGAILIFLLIQMSHTSPDMPFKVGLPNHWTDYLPFIPSEEGLPTFWTDAELVYLGGTSLEAATAAKLKSLASEFNLLCDSTRGIAWCQEIWFNPQSSGLTFQDWKIVDAMYRSRAMELPGHGLCQVPVADMANHALGMKVVARTDIDTGSKDIVLLLEQRIFLEPGSEVTISYGDEKGASEMLFSYGFIDDAMRYAGAIFLGLAADEDDPIFPAKEAFFDCAPGFRIYAEMSSENHRWDGLYVWLFCVNEEDGLGFTLDESEDGERELRATFKGKTIHDILDLKNMLHADRNWDLFQLRAYTKVNERIQQELDRRSVIKTDRLKNPWPSIDESSNAFKFTERLRDMEKKMLRNTHAQFESNIEAFYRTETVRRYLEEDPADAAARIDNELAQNLARAEIGDTRSSDGYW